MEFLESFVAFANDILWSYVLIVMLVGLGIWFSLKTRFVQVRCLKEMVRLLKEGVGQKTEHNHISSFQAFCVSTASRVGVGNIAGIAIAIVSGGPGAIFWMWIIAVLGSATGFIESTLAQIYKVPREGGGYRGGPAYYIKNVLGNKPMAALFAVLISVTFGLIFNSVQANTITVSLQAAFGLDRFVMGCIIAALTGIVIFGGVARIAKVAEWMVPIMAGLYLLIALGVTLMNIEKLPQVFATIFESAFGWQAVAGGGMGAALMTGIKRGLFSNEAGMGSVPNAAATASATHPVKQGLIQAFGVFVDTLLVCSASAFIVLLSDGYTEGKLTGIELVQQSLSQQLGPWAPSFLAGMICLFAFSSIVGNYYYGEINIGFISKNYMTLLLFRIFVVGMVLFGSVAKVALVWDMADLFMALMAITNLVAIALLGKYAYIALHDYMDQKRAGIEEPEFDPAILPSQQGIEVWHKD
ncbi:alanine/glycine:cation symporter family protein [uncultured Phascolarctobacterium sp.]|uniref:alanine/glycine:cation symporter family protein n=1 Tax=uncultured Phascolarctobacterium sp. TaxID=512296 RepID=UPI0025D9AB46|nr:alanine/glycine:cation symporter family protein [uncultured Phascolarctobacterium sp.]